MHIHFDIYGSKPEISPLEPGDDTVWVRVAQGGQTYVRMGLNREEAERFAKALQGAADQLLLNELNR